MITMGSWKFESTIALTDADREQIGRLVAGGYVGGHVFQERDAGEDDEPARIVHTVCQRCGLDVEGWTDRDDWRDRGNNSHCRTGEPHTIV